MKIKFLLRDKDEITKLIDNENQNIQKNWNVWKSVLWHYIANNLLLVTFCFGAHVAMILWDFLFLSNKHLIKFLKSQNHQFWHD